MSAPALWTARLQGSAPSLHRQLLLWLLLPQGVLWLAAALFTYNLAARYANEAIDASLLQASRALARQVIPTATGLYVDLPRPAQEILQADPSDRVFYAVSTPPGQFILGNPNLLPAPPVAQPALNQPHYYDALIADTAQGPNAPRHAVRVVALRLEFGLEGAKAGVMQVQVARSRADREQLARRILVDTALPLSLVIALMTFIVWAGIRAGLRPLAALQAQVEGRAATDLTPIQLAAAPPEVRSLAQAMNSLLAEVQHHVAAQRRFISDAAHQLRTPLAGLKSQTELALGETQDPQLRARLERVRQSAARSAHLVAQLLLLARAEPESARVQNQSLVDLRRLAQDLTAEWVPRALHAGVDLGFDDPAPAQPALVRGIEPLLREALVNLIDNALRYAGHGASVTVRVQGGGEQVGLEVEDSGPGLPPEQHTRVFERFVRGSSEGEGCGLGLAIVREIVERHAGQVTLEAAQAQPPHGLRLRISLPASAASQNGGHKLRLKPPA